MVTEKNSPLSNCEHFSKFEHRASNAKMTDSESNSVSESKSKEGISDKRTLSNCKQTHMMSPQIHGTYNVEMVEHETTSETDEEPDGHQESEQTMVPSDPSKWTSSHINEWISWCSRTFAIRLGSIATILPSTGKELLQLTLQNWQDIGGSEGGILARHLAHLRLQATGVYTPGLLQENEDSERTGKLNGNLVLDLSRLNGE